MTQTITLAAVAALLAFGSGAARAQAVLYDQTTPVSGIGSIAMNFLDPGFDVYDTDAADDFTVPAGQVWRIDAIDVVGSWVPGVVPLPPATDLAMNVTIHRGLRPGQLPGLPVARFTDIPVDVWSSPNIAITLPSPVRLNPGTYWVSVQLNVTYLQTIGYWTWNLRSAQAGAPAAWRNRGGAWAVGCLHWGHLADCSLGPSVPGDHAFALRGAVE